MSCSSLGAPRTLASPQAWRTLVRTLYQKEWVVYAKEPFGGPEQVLKYLTGYTHRVALSNRRLVKLQDDRVTFTWKDYANGCTATEMTLDAWEFVRRFALHIVPKGLVRIRRFGLLAHRDRGERLALCRSLLAAPAAAAGVREAPWRSHRAPSGLSSEECAGNELCRPCAAYGPTAAGVRDADRRRCPGGFDLARRVVGGHFLGFLHCRQP